MLSQGQTGGCEIAPKVTRSRSLSGDGTAMARCRLAGDAGGEVYALPQRESGGIERFVPSLHPLAGIYVLAGAQARQIASTRCDRAPRCARSRRSSSGVGARDNWSEMQNMKCREWQTFVDRAGGRSLCPRSRDGSIAAEQELVGTWADLVSCDTVWRHVGCKKVGLQWVRHRVASHVGLVPPPD